VWREYGFELRISPISFTYWLGGPDDISELIFLHCKIKLDVLTAYSFTKPAVHGLQKRNVRLSLTFMALSQV
jgi:hypothetical protein